MKNQDTDDAAIRSRETMFAIAADAINRFVHGIEDLGIAIEIEDATLLKLRSSAIEATLKSWGTERMRIIDLDAPQD